jgi:hypothetical protein
MVVVMQAAEHWREYDLATVRRVFRRAGHTLPDALVGAGVVEVVNVFLVKAPPDTTCDQVPYGLSALEQSQSLAILRAVDSDDLEIVPVR